MMDEQQKPAPPEKMQRFMAPPTSDGVIAMYEAMTGRAMTKEQKIAMRAKYAAVEARQARDRAKEPRADLDL
jgi:hypothetical protein